MNFVFVSKIVQAESKNKFICALPRRSLSSGPNGAKEVQAESKSKFICALPSRSLSSGPNGAKEVQTEAQTTRRKSP
ncbi:hypothetical protein B5F38_03580 [Barnesiella sp. An22]|nr:hypothetical protein B5F38_03580 [Barnesiella sp. An22]